MSTACTRAFIVIACTYQTNGIPVGDPNPVLLRDPKVFRNNHNGDEYRDPDGRVHRRRRDRELRSSDSLESAFGLSKKYSRAFGGY